MLKHSKMFSNFACFSILLLYVVTVSNCDDNASELTETYCEGAGWVPYKDMKCFKLIKKSSTREQAKELCTKELSQNDSSTPQLVSISTAAEQEFLSKYVFDTSAIEINVWIGAKRVSSNSNAFEWDDGSAIGFTNWVDDSPTEVARRACVVMQSEFTRGSGANSEKAKWRDVTCEQINYVLCQKPQKWTFVKLQQTLLDTRKNLQDSLDQVTNELDATKDELAETKEQLTEILNANCSYVPIGFIYVQLPNERPPTEIWPFGRWKDITASYAGSFFRAEGGGSEAFGRTQAENSPRLTQVNRVYDYGSDTVSVYPGTWSSNFLIVTGQTSGTSGSYRSMKFYVSPGEVRPRNMAIRIWKQIG